MSERQKTLPLERYMRVAEVVAASHQSVGLTEIAALTGLPKPTVHRLINALVDTGILEADGAHYKSFTVGRRLWRILYLGLDRDKVAGYAQIVCDDLAKEVKETCYMVRLGQRHVRAIARSAPDQGHRLHVLPGSELPPHAASSAKAILAYQDSETLDRLLPDPLPALTEHTITSRADLEADLARVRETGYAICDREIDDNVMAYACPVHLAGAGVLYSLGVTGPCSRLRQIPTEDLVAALKQGASRFAHMLGSVAG